MLSALFASSERRRILLLLSGSRGDCQPYLAFVQGLQEAGFALQVVTNRDHCEAFKSFGVDALGADYDSEEVVRSSDVMREAMSSGQLGKFFEGLVALELPLHEELVKQCCIVMKQFQPDLIIASALPRTLALNLSFQYGIPVVIACLQDVSPTRFEPSILREPSWLPGWCHLAAHFLIWTMACKSRLPYVEIQQKVLPDIRPYTNSLMKIMVSTRHPLLRPIAAVSPLLEKEHPDVNLDSKPLMTGAWIVDAAVQTRLMQASSKLFGGNKEFGETLAFIEESGSSPPVYMGWGSMIAVSAEHMARLAVKSLMVLGRRGIILGGFAELKETMLEGEPDLQAYASKNVRFLPVAPHELLFPKCAAVVHHGGAGTFNAALRAAVPQVITPCFVDQFKHAGKVNELKVGVGLPRFHQCTPKTLASALNLVLSDSSIQENARWYGRELRKEEESSVAMAVNEIKRDFAEEIDTGKWKAKFEERKLLLKNSKKAMVNPSFWAWIYRIFFSRAPNNFLADL